MDWLQRRRLHVCSLVVIFIVLSQSLAAAVPLVDDAREPFRPGMLLPSGGGPLDQWLKVWRQWREERQALEACREDRSKCTDAAAHFIAIVDSARSLSGRAQLGEINRRVNLAIKPVGDLDAHGSADLWSSPLATLTMGSGDCEDYAILKFAALLEAGVAPEQLRLLIVWNSTRSEHHAVVSVKDGEQWLLLDNEHLAILADTQLPNYSPVLLVESASVRRYAEAPRPRPETKSPADLAGGNETLVF
jgi:predicted transglutaminase-like cysteine proteinase